MAEGPALWRSGLAIAACAVIGLFGGPFFVAIADSGARPVVSTLASLGVRVREPIVFGALMAILVALLGFAIGYLTRAGRWVAGWLLGFMIMESVWRPAILHAFDGGKPDAALEAVVTAVLLALIAAVALDAGRRLTWSIRPKS